MAHEPVFDLRGKTLWVTGETGLVGTAVGRRLAQEECQILQAPHAILDLTRQDSTQDWIAQHRPDVIIHTAGRVGGIGANATAPADFLYDNLAMAQHVIHGAYRAGVKKLLFLGSSCIYPKHTPQPIREESLMTGPLEETNDAYAIAKIAGLKMCQAYRKQHGCDFIAAMPTNIYGPGDRFDAALSHVIPALMVKMHRAKEEGAAQIDLWGTGAPLREFLYVDDLADALVFLLMHYRDAAPINIGSGEELSIAALADMMATIVGFNGDITFDASQPDGTLRKRLDTARMDALGWRASTPLRDGLRRTYAAFCAGDVRAQAA